MTLSTDDRIAIGEVLSWHGHLVDAGLLDRLSEVFTTDSTLDLSDVGGRVIRGLSGAQEAARALGDAHPVAHHVTNVVVVEADSEQVRTRSKGIGIRADGSCGSVTYDDVMVRTDQGWRISHRKITLRRRPLSDG